MKTTRRIAAALLALVMVFALAACGAEKTVTLQGDLTDGMGGIPTTDTWTLTAKGDIVKNVKEVLALDFSDLDDETKDTMTAMIESMIVDAAEGIDGVECVAATDGDVYTVELSVDCSGDTVKKAAEAGIIELDGTAKAISLKQTQSSLENSGYEVIE